MERHLPGGRSRPFNGEESHLSATAAKVLRLPSSPEVVDLDDGPATIALCQRAIRSSHLKDNEISLRSGVCTQSVSTIASGETKLPRRSTVVRILHVLGWRIFASKTPR